MKKFYLSLTMLLMCFPFTAKASAYYPWYTERPYVSGAATIEMGKAPAVYVFANASNGVSEGEISYSFLVTGGPTSSYVPLQFQGQFGLNFQYPIQYQGGNWSETRFAAGAADYDQLANGNFRGEGVLFDARCGAGVVDGACSANWGQLPVSNYEANRKSYINVIFDHVAEHSLSGTFFGTIFAPTDSEGYSIGSVNLLAHAGSGSAFIDPHFEILSSWLLNNANSSFSLPAGVGNELASNPLSPVPEPGSAAMLLLGLGLLATGKRAYRQHQ